VCGYVCVCMYVHGKKDVGGTRVCVYACIVCVYIHVCARMCVCVRMYMYMRVCTYVRVYERVCECIYVCVSVSVWFVGGMVGAYVCVHNPSHELS
jgi:hypothetical protein